MWPIPYRSLDIQEQGTVSAVFFKIITAKVSCKARMGGVERIIMTLFSVSWEKWSGN